MTTSVGAPVVDSDGHVLEPADTWLKYLEPSYRDRAIRIAEDEHGYEVLLIDGLYLGRNARTGRCRGPIVRERRAC